MSEIGKRKDHHLDLCLNEEVESGRSNGFEGLSLEYDALPEVDLDEVDLSVELLGRTLKAPIIIGAMTGGSKRAEEINQRLARAAARAGVGMALGSQRAMLNDPSLKSSYDVKRVAPELPLLIANIGAVQLNYGVKTKDVQTLIDDVDADAINFHLNPLQEAIQPEGDTRFKGIYQRLKETIPELSKPALVKEVGSGISKRTAEKLASLALKGVEVAGVGGTSWARVESYRNQESDAAEIGQRLAGFGITTRASLQVCRDVLSDDWTLIASGGIRYAKEIALSLALGVNAAALAKPFLEAAEKSEDDVFRLLNTLIQELKIIAFCTGCKYVDDFRAVRILNFSNLNYLSE